MVQRYPLLVAQGDWLSRGLPVRHRGCCLVLRCAVDRSARRHLRSRLRRKLEDHRPHRLCRDRCRGTFLLAAILPWILNKLSRFDRFEARQNAAEAAGDQISLIIDQAMLEGRFVELSLANRKSYVGSPVQGTFGHRDAGDVALIPIASGYRDKDSRDLVITTNYAPAIEDQLSELALDDLKVAFPMRDIVSARLFDQNLYASFLDDSAASS